jgi:hypothetical protein
VASALMLLIVPVTIDEAKRFVARLHRHNKPPAGAKFAVGVADEAGELRGVALAGRPVAPALDDGIALEITRCCTDGARNACSMLYGAGRRAARALGHRPIYTYSLPEEGGGESARCRISVGQGRCRRPCAALAQPPGAIRRTRGRRPDRRQMAMGGVMAHQTARLKNWSVVQWGNDRQRLAGIVYGHPDQARCPDGHEILTSPLVYLDERIGIGVTLNTVYVLRDVPDADVLRIVDGIEATV